MLTLIMWFIIFRVIFYLIARTFENIGYKIWRWQYRNHNKWGQNFLNAIISFVLFVILGSFAQLLTPGFFTFLIFCIQILLLMLSIGHLFGLG
jgi:hypothetical protein